MSLSNAAPAPDPADPDAPDTFWLIPVPDSPRALALRAQLEREECGPVEAGLELTRARRWSFFVTPQTHFDLGYTDLQDQVWRFQADDLDAAIDLVEATASLPEPSRFRWTVETTHLVRNYERWRGPAGVERLRAALQTGRVEVCGFALNMLTELVSPEGLVRCLYGADAVRRRYGVPVRGAMINDVPGYAWWLPQLLHQAGIETLSVRANAYRAKFVYDRPDLPARPFYWEGPDGTKILTWLTDSYREANFAREPDPTGERFIANIIGYIRRNEAAGYPFDAVQLRAGGDNLPVSPQLAESVRQWNETWTWPRVSFATHSEFFDHLLAHSGGRISTIRGDIPDWWADGAASSAYETGLNRRTHWALGNAEALSALAARNGRAAYPRELLASALDDMLLYDEHTWGNSRSVHEPGSLQTRGQWAQKSTFAYRAAVSSERALRRSLDALFGRAVAASDALVVVFNPHLWPRTELVEVEVPAAWLTEPSLAARDLATGETGLCQETNDPTEQGKRRLVFLARDVPPVGYRRYELIPCATSVESPFRSGEAWLEGPHYRVEVAPDGGIVSLYDRALSQELVDSSAPYRLNQYISESYSGGRGVGTPDRWPGVVWPTGFDPHWAVTDIQRASPEAARVSLGARGPLFASLRVESELAGRAGVTAEIILPAHAREVRLINNVDKVETLAEEAAYLAFPFALASPDARLEITGAVMRPERDQLPGTCRDLYSVQSWVDITTSPSSGSAPLQWGVTWSPLEAPVVHIGGMFYEAWLDRLELERGWLFSHLFNNHWDTNYKASQGGPHIFRYALTSHAGPADDAAATRFGWDTSDPLVVWLGSRSTPEPSLPEIGVDRPGLVLLALKQAEGGSGLVLRLKETSGHGVKATIRWSDGQPFAAWQTDLLEHNQRQLSASRSEVEVVIPALGLVTLQFDRTWGGTTGATRPG